MHLNIPVFCAEPLGNKQGTQGTDFPGLESEVGVAPYDFGYIHAVLNILEQLIHFGRIFRFGRRHRTIFEESAVHTGLHLGSVRPFPLFANVVPVLLGGSVCFVDVCWRKPPFYGSESHGRR